MPTMANITVKAADGTTDIVMTALSASSGDGNAAVWRREETNKVPAHRITAEFKTMWNGPKTARRAHFAFRAPILFATAVAGIYDKVGEIRYDTANGWIIPQMSPLSFTAECVAICNNMIASPLIRQGIIDGYSMT